MGAEVRETKASDSSAEIEAWEHTVEHVTVRLESMDAGTTRANVHVTRLGGRFEAEDVVKGIEERLGQG